MTDTATLPNADAPADWRPLPPRARTLFMLGHGAVGLVLAGPATGFAFATQWVSPLVAPFAAAAIGAAIGAWIGAKRFRSTAWRLDDDGFGLRRGRLFFRETRVPASRVQHLDLRHGPLERRWKLATLVIHTAGSRMSAVSVTGLDAGDAEQLRDRLARQLDADDAL